MASIDFLKEQSDLGPHCFNRSICPAQSEVSLTANQGFASWNPGPATYFRGDLS